MPTYYRSHEVLITSETYVWRADPVRVHRIKDLRDVGIVRGELTNTGLTSTYSAAAGVGMVATVTWPVFHSPIALAGGLTLALALAVTALATSRDQRHCWELRATCGDARVVLYVSTDGPVFRQVTRGLMRALEADGQAGWYELAGG